MLQSSRSDFLHLSNDTAVSTRKPRSKKTTTTAAAKPSATTTASPAQHHGFPDIEGATCDNDPDEESAYSSLYVRFTRKARRDEGTERHSREDRNNTGAIAYAATLCHSPSLDWFAFCRTIFSSFAIHPSRNVRLLRDSPFSYKRREREPVCQERKWNAHGKVNSLAVFLAAVD